MSDTPNRPIPQTTEPSPTNTTTSLPRKGSTERPLRDVVPILFQANNGEENSAVASASTHEHQPALPPIAVSLSGEMKGFLDILIAFKVKYPEEPKGRVGKYSIRSKTSWQEVLDVLSDAGEAYDPKNGLRKKANGAKEFIENKADLIVRLASLIPDVDYAKPILGTLTFLLHAFQQTSKVRKEVKEAAEELTRSLDLVEIYIQMYSTKIRVVDATTRLHITMLKATEDVIGYYTRHLMKKGILALWKGKNYEESLLESLGKISTDIEDLRDEASIAHQQIAQEQAGITINTSKDVQSGLNKMNNLQSTVEALKADYDHGIKLLIEDSIKTREAHEREKQIWNSEKHAMMALYLRTITPEPVPALESMVSQERLLSFLDLSDIDSVDMEYISHQRELVLACGRGRSEQIMKSPRLRDWLVQADSKELLIHGNLETMPISPISFFSARLMKNLRAVKQFKSVVFFCGCHSYEDYGGARTLIMSLITQLLQQQRFDLSFITYEKASMMDNGELEAFCYVFGQLLQQVRGSETVFCIIDGINFYESYGEDLLQEMAYVVRFLLDLTRNRGVMFKILITSPSITHDVRQAVRDEDYLGLVEQAADSSRFSDLLFERRLQESYEGQSRP